jgi:hypothetical protein
MNQIMGAAVVAQEHRACQHACTGLQGIVRELLQAQCAGTETPKEQTTLTGRRASKVDKEEWSKSIFQGQSSFLLLTPGTPVSSTSMSPHKPKCMFS